MEPLFAQKNITFLSTQLHALRLFSKINKTKLYLILYLFPLNIIHTLDSYTLSLFIHLSIYVYLSVYSCVYICLIICLHICLSIRLCICLYISVHLTFLYQRILNDYTVPLKIMWLKYLLTCATLRVSITYFYLSEFQVSVSKIFNNDRECSLFQIFGVSSLARKKD